ncbi:hypothetical protein [Paenibacillus sp. XY044]|uniref:hypothetical protein n=1 Tax=Paenibacillus sp. XY044 TaxID=2026089 RepID=UPI000B99CF56|nr:hypothetical protein [Paenibacillus sp. XY044]OZB90081.1 hypothetical protein CJP46_35475 [Paenibacillus sp. XY044]
MSEIREVSDRIRTEHKSFWINDDLYTKYFPKIIVNGKEAFITDKSTPTGFIECDTRDDARQLAREYRDRAKARLKSREEAEA